MRIFWLGKTEPTVEEQAILAELWPEHLEPVRIEKLTDQSQEEDWVCGRRDSLPSLRAWGKSGGHFYYFEYGRERESNTLIGVWRDGAYWVWNRGRFIQPALAS